MIIKVPPPCPPGSRKTSVTASVCLSVCLFRQPVHAWRFVYHAFVRWNLAFRTMAREGLGALACFSLAEYLQKFAQLDGFRTDIQWISVVSNFIVVVYD